MSPSGAYGAKRNYDCNVNIYVVEFPGCVIGESAGLTAGSPPRRLLQWPGASFSYGGVIITGKSAGLTAGSPPRRLLQWPGA
ncbi:hypothetical protein GCM10007160_42190 [Litchfieldella qijiaojingensis]|uniref:Uncharacterized protein n=1 Tax=Litchfieldella qijiaojingensis TaxID=980347 RepID=A0ABQ2ZB28_9GAMM|nr:hypothetical protein GCM10007160_42190 [Halomonas qijiaojingensis]